MDFTALHHHHTPLLVANVWDASSAQAAQQAGYLALGTSSAAIADMLGYDDGEAISFDELLFVVTRIQAVNDLPLSVDMEAGYGSSPGEIVDNLLRLASLGVVGVNLEDSRVIDGVRQLEDAAEFAGKLREIRARLAEKQCSLFLNIRTDTFLLNVEQALAWTLHRGRLYSEQGADGFFVPCVMADNDITAIVQQVPLPLNVMSVPGIGSFSRLAALGVRRISMGNFVHSALQTRLKKLLLNVQAQQTCEEIFSDESYR